MKNPLKILLILVLILTLSACGQLGETPEKPWQGFAKHKEKKKLQWWFVTYESYDECIETMEWDVTNTENKAWYTKPVGCGYASNNYIKSLFMNIIIADITHFECLVESKNPKIRKMKMKYGPVLKGYKNDCVNNSKQTIIYK